MIGQLPAVTYHSVDPLFDLILETDVRLLHQRRLHYFHEQELALGLTEGFPPLSNDGAP